MSDGPLVAGVYRFVVPPSHAEERLDHFLASRLEGASRSLCKFLIDLGGVHVDGRRTRRCSQPVSTGQRVELYVDGRPLESFRLEATAILYRDQYLIALNKPAGIATQPTPARYQGTLYAALQQHLASSGKVHIGMVQRLDRDTSGVILFSTHPKAHKNLTEAFRQHQVRKHYLALLNGHVREDSGEIRSLLARRRSTNRMVSVDRGGKLAITRFQVIERFAGGTLVAVVIETGRTHQIRIHFAEAGHPLWGDSTYGGPVDCGGTQVTRQMLHANALQVNHPVHGGELSLQAPLPADFQNVMRVLGAMGHR